MSMWYYAKNHEQFGPVSEADLEALIVAGKVDRSDLVWRDGLPDWVQAGSQPALSPVPPPSAAGPGASPLSPPKSPPALAGPRQGSATSALPLNTGLYRVHRLFFIAFAGFAVIMLVIGVLILLQGRKDWPVGLMGLAFLPIGVAHWYAAKGVRSGKVYGKIISRIFGILWLFGFPLGTMLGVYVLFQTGKDSWNGGIDQAAAPLSIDLLIRNLQGEIPQYEVRRYLPREAAYEQLKQITGQDFGMDAKSWKSWYKTNK